MFAKKGRLVPPLFVQKNFIRPVFKIVLTKMIHDKASISAELLKNTGSFTAHFSEKNLAAKPAGWPETMPEPGKWSPLQHLDHLCISVKTVNNYLRWVPKWVFRWRFGTPNRPGRSFDELVARYHEKLLTQNPAVNPFSSGTVTTAKQTELLAFFENGHHDFVQLFSKWPENDLDTTLVPHPLLGKITMREMLFFMAYHIRHHEMIVEKV